MKHIPGISDAPFDDLMDLWIRIWPYSQLAFTRDAELSRWQCHATVNFHEPNRWLWPPVGVGPTPTDALRAIFLSFIHEDNDIAKLIEVSISQPTPST